MKVVFLVPYPLNSAPSQRFRFEQYLNFLKEQNIEYEVCPFIDIDTWKVLYSKGNFVKKSLGIIKGFLRRIHVLGKIHGSDRIFIHREASPVGPPFFEWMIASVFRKKIIYDFDDAIWLPNTSNENLIAAKLKWHSKVKWICKWSFVISAGNRYLADFAGRYNGNVVVNPTTIDTGIYHYRIKDLSSNELVIGWTGTRSTLKYLDQIVPVIRSLEIIYAFTFAVIADTDPNLPLNSYRFIKWNPSTEIDDLLMFNIGIMPLDDDPWSKGKCGFKALQYMALGIPTVASPVGANVDIVDEGQNGYLCSTEAEWKEKLRLLINDPDLRSMLGRHGRAKVEQQYSVNSNKDNFLRLFV